MILSMTTNGLLKDIEKFLTDTGMLPTAFGKDALNDPNFVFDLRQGRDYRNSTAERIKNFIENYNH